MTVRMGEGFGKPCLGMRRTEAVRGLPHRKGGWDVLPCLFFSLTSGKQLMDERYMRRALELAERGRWTVSPNPMVGAVVLAGTGEVAGEGYHRRAGDPHAEIHALKAAGERARGGTLVCTLEPCCHTGRTPPCTRAITESGLARVVAAGLDPNPQVAGRGVEELRRAGVEVEVGLLAGEAAHLNEVFFHYTRTQRPFVVLKAAATLDGKIALARGQRSTLTGAVARERVHRLRAEADAILVGVETVLIDDPLLTCRLPEFEGRSPLRIVVDSSGRTPLDARLLYSKGEAPVAIAVTGRCSDERARRLRSAGAEVWVLPERDGRVDLPRLLEFAGGREITSLVVEGGAQINASFLAEGLVDKFLLFFAPLVAGSPDAPDLFGGRAAGALRIEGARTLGSDLLIEAYPAAVRAERRALSEDQFLVAQGGA